MASSRRTVLVAAPSATLTVAATLGVLWAAGTFATQQHSRQAAVAERGASVMPFDLEKTTHVFTPTESGGVEEVVADDPTDEKQVSLIRGHLEKEAAAFRRGDYSDPSSIHGQDMPGLKELEADHEKVEVRYSELPDGGRIEFSTGDPTLVRALHRWFDAQLSDHGADAERGGASGHEQHEGQR
jgi:hypothetical protein